MTRPVLDATGEAEERRERARRILRDDFLVYPPRVLQIVNSRGDTVPFVLKRPQVRLARGLMAQRADGLPMRAVVLKARKVGFSTQTQGMIVQRATQIPNHYALVVGQDTKTAGEIFTIGRRMWAGLPASMKPSLAYERNSRGGMKYMTFGEPSLLARRAGHVGLDSTIEISTAKEVDAGRGLTIRSLHLSEVAFWMYPDKKLGLLNAVPDDEDTLIIEESTANAYNHFKDDWDEAVAGTSGYLAMFTPWFEEEGYQHSFLNDIDRGRFVDSIGTGRWGDAEPKLLELMLEEIPRLAEEAEMPLADDELGDALLERCYRHLKWRRWAIPAKCQSSITKFMQEYPATAEEAFIASGRKVFDAEAIQVVLSRVEKTDPSVATREAPGPARGGFVNDQERVIRAARGVTITVPTSVKWTPAKRLPEGMPAAWELWAAPQVEQIIDGRRRPAGQYIVALDPMSGEEDDRGTLANHAIQVINHRTLEQVAQYESQDDPDQVALEALKVALYFNRAWVAVETTGGWGLSIVQKLARDVRYPFLYVRDSPQARTAKRQDRIGWSTDSVTKPAMIDRGRELLREQADGIRSRRLALQLLSYTRDQRGRTAPEAGKLADLLMAWLIAQKVAETRPVRPDRPRGATSTATRTVRSSATGW